MNAWFYIVIGVILIGLGGISVKYGWHIMPKSESKKDVSKSAEIKKTRGIPLIDLYFERVKADPQFSQFEIQFSYDIYVHNKSRVTLSQIKVYRSIDPTKNKQKIAIHPKARGKVGPFNKKVNILAPGEKKKIYRERSTSYEYCKFDITYQDEYGKHYECIFEGDRDGLLLKGNKEIFPKIIFKKSPDENSNKK